MEKVSFNSCVKSPAYNYYVQQGQLPKNQVGFFREVNNSNLDTVKIRSKKEVQLEKLNNLFSQGGIERVYDEINRDFGVINKPSLKFYGDNDGIAAGGYTFNKNEISLSLSDLLESDTKLIGIKDGKRTLLSSPKIKLPLFIDKKTAQYFIYAQSKKGNMGYDKIIAEPLTEDEQRKFIVQKISHEVIHAQQHQIMSQTEGIGEKEVFKAWTHYKPKNLIDKYIFDFRIEKEFEKTYWAKQNPLEKIYTPESKEGQFAKEWLEAVRNYPPVESEEYTQNAIEKDAYERSFVYAESKFGDWNV